MLCNVSKTNNNLFNLKCILEKKASFNQRVYVLFLIFFTLKNQTKNFMSIVKIDENKRIFVTVYSSMVKITMF